MKKNSCPHSIFKSKKKKKLAIGFLKKKQKVEKTNPCLLPPFKSKKIKK
jgi:hypothetical protein